MKVFERRASQIIPADFELRADGLGFKIQNKWLDLAIKNGVEVHFYEIERASTEVRDILNRMKVKHEVDISHPPKQSKIRSLHRNTKIKLIKGPLGMDKANNNNSNNKKMKTFEAKPDELDKGYFIKNAPRSEDEYAIVARDIVKDKLVLRDSKGIYTIDVNSCDSYMVTEHIYPCQLFGGFHFYLFNKTGRFLKIAGQDKYVNQRTGEIYECDKSDEVQKIIQQ